MSIKISNFFLIFVISAFIEIQAQTFYFNTKKDVIKQHKKKRNELFKKEKIDLPFPLQTVWIRDSVFIDESEVTLSEWATGYILYKDSSYKKREDYEILRDYNVDSIYSTKNLVAYTKLVHNSVLLSTNFLYSHKVDKPVIFVDTIQINDYIGYINKEINKVISTQLDHWYWNMFFTNKWVVKYELLDLKDYLLALKIYNNIEPQIVITDLIPSDRPVPIDKYKNYQKGEKITGLTNNASEIVLLKDEYYVVYKVDATNIYISKYTQSDFHIGFRLKCTIKKK